jgi:hypothetical protein
MTQIPSWLEKKTKIIHQKNWEKAEEELADFIKPAENILSIAPCNTDSHLTIVAVIQVRTYQGA